MLRKISFGLLCIAASLSVNANTMDPNFIQPAGISVEYDFPPNQPQLFTNYMFWTIEANCKMITEDESDELYAIALAKRGKINDIPLSSGESIQVTIRNNDNLKVSADSGAKVEITNLGKHLVKASCTT